MSQEIERKFRVASDAWRRSEARSTSRITQAYLSGEGSLSIRLRLRDGQGTLTLKNRASGLQRQEFEYEIPAAEVEAMMQTFSLERRVVKDRHVVLEHGNAWEIDVYREANKGLVVAELELPSRDAEFERPDWLGEEVTGCEAYGNEALAEKPFGTWKPQTKENE